jgi:hypothetical protein
MGNDTLIHSEYYQGFGIEVIETPDSDLWTVGYYYCVYNDDGTERLDSNECYEPKDFLYRDANDALRAARWMIDRYWQQGERWHVSDEKHLALSQQ